jgi:5-methylcytosine-specific restriction endonuclease McrA
MSNQGCPGETRDDRRRYIASIHYEYKGGSERLRPAYRDNIFPSDKSCGGGFRVFRPIRLPHPTPRNQ